VLIALTLVTLCAFPLLAPHIIMVRGEKEFLYELEADRIANNVFSEIVKNLYENRISWQELQSEQSYPVPEEWQRGFSLPPAWPYSMRFRFEKKREKVEELKESYYLFKVVLNFETPSETQADLEFTYLVYIQRIAEEFEGEKNDQA